MPNSDALDRLEEWMKLGFHPTTRWANFAHGLNGGLSVTLYDFESGLARIETAAQAVTLSAALHAALDQAEARR